MAETLVMIVPAVLVLLFVAGLILATRRLRRVAQRHRATAEAEQWASSRDQTATKYRDQAATDYAEYLRQHRDRGPH